MKNISAANPPYVSFNFFSFRYIYNMLKNSQNKKQNKELFKNIFKNIKPSQSRCLCGSPGFSPAASRRCRRPLRGLQMQKKEGKRKAKKSMHLINKRKGKEREKEKCTTNTKKYAERAWPCGRAASGRVAWREALKKYTPKPEQNLLQGGFHCCRMGQTAAPRPTKPKRKGKKTKKRAGGPKSPA